MNTPQDPLDARLAEWRLAPTRNPEFRRSVRSRLDSARSVPWLVYVRGHGAVVAALLLVALSLGAIAGREQARLRVAAESQRLADDYVQALDARTMRMP